MCVYHIHIYMTCTLVCKYQLVEVSVFYVSWHDTYFILIGILHCAGCACNASCSEQFVLRNPVLNSFAGLPRLACTLDPADGPTCLSMASGHYLNFYGDAPWELCGRETPRVACLSRKYCSVLHMEKLEITTYVYYMVSRISSRRFAMPTRIRTCRRLHCSLGSIHGCFFSTPFMFATGALDRTWWQAF